MITASRGGSVAAASEKKILSQSVTLFEAVNSDSPGGDGSKPSTILSGECFNFSLSFSTYVANGRDCLPPSQALSQQGTYCSIDYTLRVDIVRKGLRRHERCASPSALVLAERTWCSFMRTSTDYQGHGTGHVLTPLHPTQPNPIVPDPRPR